MESIKRLKPDKNNATRDAIVFSKVGRILKGRSPNIAMHQLYEIYSQNFNKSRQLSLCLESSTQSQFDRMFEDTSNQFFKALNEYLATDQFSLHEALIAFREVFGSEKFIFKDYEEITRSEYTFSRALFTSSYLV